MLAPGGLAAWLVTCVDPAIVADVESDLEFYTRRSMEERRLARLALTDDARDMHARLAQEYAAKARQLRGIVTDI